MKAKKLLTACFVLLCVVGCRSNTQPPTPEANSTSTPGTKAEEKETKVINASEDFKFEYETVLPDMEPGREFGLEEALQASKEMAAAAQKYYDDYNSMIEFVCRNGFLYSCPGDEYIDMLTLVDLGGLDERYNNCNPVILYVNPLDVKNILNGTVSNKETEDLTIYSVVKTGDDYAFATAQGTEGVVAQSDFNKLINSYAQNSGDIYRYGAENPEYTEILNICAESDGIEPNSLDARYLVADDKHAFVLASQSDRPTAFKSYALEFTGDKWKVELSNFHNQYQSKKLVNAKLPLFNYALFPVYDTFYQIKHVTSNLDEILNAMESQLNISSTDKMTFSSGTGEFIYFSYESGLRYLATCDEENVWMVNPVGNYLIAEKLLAQKSADPPLFIVKQE